MHIIYLITLHRKELPNKYIGSKSNCEVRDNIIWNNKGKPYYTSSNNNDLKMWLKSKKPYSIEILQRFNSYSGVILAEALFQTKYDVVASPEFFNKSIANYSNFTDPSYATYKHSVTEKIARLPISHPKVLSKEWVGITHGIVYSDERRKKHSKSNSGKKNGFYGKQHSKDTKNKIGLANSTKKRTPEFKAMISLLFKGKCLSRSHKRKIGRKGFMQLKSILTGESVRIRISDRHLYDESIWKNPYALAVKMKHTCPYCGISCTIANFNRWHNNNCKHKTK